MTTALERQERLRQAKTAYKEWREGWDEWVKTQRDRQKERLVQNIEDAALDMAENGASVHHIAQIYGTQERRTINRLLERAGARRYSGDDTPGRVG